MQTISCINDIGFTYFYCIGISDLFIYAGILEWVSKIWFGSETKRNLKQEIFAGCLIQNLSLVACALAFGSILFIRTFNMLWGVFFTAYFFFGMSSLWTNTIIYSFKSEHLEPKLLGIMNSITWIAGGVSTVFIGFMWTRSRYYIVYVSVGCCVFLFVIGIVMFAVASTLRTDREQSLHMEQASEDICIMSVMEDGFTRFKISRYASEF
eukprot:809723_1